MTSPGSWVRLHDRSYHKRTLYRLEWDASPMDLRKYLVAGAPFGGPIATLPNMQRAHQLNYRNADLLRPHLSIYSCAGRLISSQPWPHQNTVALGWTDSETLLVILDDGTVHLYSIHGDLVSSFLVHDECREQTVAECLVFSDGLVCRTAASSSLYAVTNVADPQARHVRRLFDSGLGIPQSMAVIPPAVTASGSVEVLLATVAGSIVVVDERAAQDQQLVHSTESSDPLSRMVVSPSGGLVACYTSRGTLLVLSTDFTQNLCKFATNSKVDPHTIAWCGDEAVVLYWDDILLVVGPYGDYVKYTYDGPVVLVPECDGLRVLTNSQCELLYRVPDSIRDIFAVGSVRPAALLHDAAEAYEAGDARADDLLRVIAGEDAPPEALEDALEDAIEVCLDAAAHAFDLRTQRALLKAASYGALFCPRFAADRFVDTCKEIRILNAVRKAEVGMPLTYEQFTRLELEVVIDRLVNRHHHLLAMRICEYMRIPPQRVLVHWACAKIRLSEQNDDELAHTIITKLDRYPHISYAKIVRAALDEGRPALATQLLECEPRAAFQVPLFLNMGEDDLALEKAIESGDTDLIYLALLHIKRSSSEEELLAMVEHRPVARYLLVKYCAEHDPDLLMTFFYTFRAYADAANHTMTDGYQPDRSWAERISALEIARDFYAKDPACKFMHDATKAQIRFEELRRAFVAEHPDALLPPTTVSELLRALVAKDDLSQARQVQKEFGISEARFWHIQVRAYAQERLWPKLDALSNSKRTPVIGLENFVEACLEEGATHEALRYIERLPDRHAQMEWYVNIGRWKEAVEVAARNSDVDALQHIRSMCRDDAVRAMVDRCLAGLAGGRG